MRNDVWALQTQDADQRMTFPLCLHLELRLIDTVIVDDVRFQNRDVVFSLSADNLFE